MNVPGRVFHAIDPRGRTVWCGVGAWKHICRDHPDLATAQDIIRDVIVHPDEIYADAEDEIKECYYRFDIQVHNVVCSLKVVVAFGAGSVFLGGAISTAYEKFDVSPGHVKRGEVKLWP